MYIGVCVCLSVAQAIEMAVKMMKPSPNIDPYYRQQAWQLLQVQYTCHVLVL